MIGQFYYNCYVISVQSADISAYVITVVSNCAFEWCVFMLVALFGKIALMNIIKTDHTCHIDQHRFSDSINIVMLLAPKLLRNWDQRL